MKIKYCGDNRIENYTKLGRIIPKNLTEIDIISFFDTQTRSEKEIVEILRNDSNIYIEDVAKEIIEKIHREEEKKTTDIVKSVDKIVEDVKKGRRK